MVDFSNNPDAYEHISEFENTSEKFHMKYLGSILVVVVEGGKETVKNQLKKD